MGKHYFHHLGNETFGPLSSKELKLRAELGMVALDDWISVSDGRRDLARNVSGLFKAASQPKVTPKSHQKAEVALSDDNPPFSSPVSKLLNSLTVEVLNCMSVLSKQGAIPEADFNKRAKDLLMDLQGAVAECEARPKDRRPPAASSAEQKTAGSPSALRLGLAALVGGAWGYLLGQRPAYGSHLHQAGFFDIPHAAADPGPDLDGNLDFSRIATADLDGDGNVEAAIADTDGDGDVDLAAYDVDDDGDVDKIYADTDNDGDLEQVFDDHADDLDDGGLDADFEADAADFGDFDGGDFGFDGFDFDFG